MVHRMIGGLGVAALVALAAPSTARAQAEKAKAPEGKEMTISGTVIDMACKFTKGVSGEAHKQCAQVCANAGLPLAILGNDGTMYVPISDAPGKGVTDQLKPHIEHKVTVTGKVYSTGGVQAIAISSITM